MQLHFLTCPQSLSDDVLRDILKDRCIELTDFKSMCKIELIEIFKRVALPLPQRIYNGERLLGRKMQSLRSSRNISVADNNENINYNVETTEACDADKKLSEDSMKSCSDCIKSSIKDTEVIQKRIRQSNIDQSETALKDSCDMKRKFEVPLPTDSNKRQKITWP